MYTYTEHKDEYTEFQYRNFLRAIIKASKTYSMSWFLEPVNRKQCKQVLRKWYKEGEVEQDERLKNLYYKGIRKLKYFMRLAKATLQDTEGDLNG